MGAVGKVAEGVGGETGVGEVDSSAAIFQISSGSGSAGEVWGKAGMSSSGVRGDVSVLGASGVVSTEFFSGSHGIGFEFFSGVWDSGE
ncbi:MAG: hypothetical protein JWL81_2061, partial [Verrucomicrobiales bacterium]|nr:hypothetical protein [Verrucomicrobiales bacterium]